MAATSSVARRRRLDTIHQRSANEPMSAAPMISRNLKS